MYYKLSVETVIRIDTAIIILIFLLNTNVGQINAVATANSNGNLKHARPFSSSKVMKIDTNVDQFAVGEGFIIFRKGDKAYTYGLNNVGQIGNGKINELKPVLKPYKVCQDVKEVFASEFIAAVLKKNSRVYAWGLDSRCQFFNDWGEKDDEALYHGSKEIHKKPEKAFNSVSRMWCRAGTVAYQKDNKIYARGIYTYFDGDETGFRPMPDEFITKDADKYKKVAIHNNCMLFLSKDSKVSACGRISALNPYYKAGTDSWYMWSALEYSRITNKLTQIYRLKVLDISPGELPGIIKENGDLMVWGPRTVALMAAKKEDVTKDIVMSSAEIPNAKYTPNEVYSNKIRVFKSVKSVSTSLHGLIVKKDNTLWGWGSNSKGELGSGCKSKYVYTPVKIMTGVKLAVAGNGFSVVLKTDGTLYWFGQLSCYAY